MVRRVAPLGASSSVNVTSVVGAPGVVDVGIGRVRVPTKRETAWELHRLHPHGHHQVLVARTRDPTGHHGARFER
jgi:hypothetical protein